MSVWAGAVLTGILSGVLVVSGVLKLPDSGRTVAAMRGFRVPSALQTATVAVLFAMVEIALGALMIVGSGPWFIVASWGQTTLYALYVVLVASALLRRDDVVCNCFGVMSSRPVGAGSLVRNVLLLAGSVLVSCGVFGWQSVVSRVARFGPAEWLGVLVLAAVVALTIGAVAMSRRVRRAQARREFVGHVVEVDARLLVFMTATCAGCSAIAPSVKQWAAALPSATELVIVTLSDADEFARVYPELAFWVMQGSDAVRDAFGVSVVPAAVLLNSRDEIEAGPEYSRAGLDDVVAGAVSRATAKR